MNATIKQDSMMQRLRKMAQEIEITGNSRELTDLEQIMTEMLVEGSKITTKAIQTVEEVKLSIDRAISAGHFWRRTAYTMAVVVIFLSGVILQLLIG